MLARNFTRKPHMNVDDVLQDTTPEKIYSSVLFTLVNLPYRDNSIDIEEIEIDGVNYKCYKNRYDFSNGKLIIIKIASTELVPFGIYARKVMNFLIAEFSYKKNFPSIYDNDTSRRMINLGKKPIDFIEKICGTRNPGTRRHIILKQLEAILNCYMAIATGYKQIAPEDDEIFADKCQFALIETTNKQLINHKFDVINNWQEEVHMSGDLAKILSQHIMPLDKDIYSKITSPLELDVYQYFTYQNYTNVQRGITEVRYDWDEIMSIFGRGYAKDSKGVGNFRRDFRISMSSLHLKINLSISAPLDSKYITFKPSASLLLDNKKLLTKSNNDLKFDPYKDMFDALASSKQKINTTSKVDVTPTSDWISFARMFNLAHKFDSNSINLIKTYFDKNADNTRKTVKYVLEQATKNPSAFVKKALAGNWATKYEEFNQKLSKWKNDYQLLNDREVQKLSVLANSACSFLQNKYHPEEFSQQILTLIYMRFNALHDTKALLLELDGSKYQQYFKRHFELLSF